jgi:hypothetical protein
MQTAYPGYSKSSKEDVGYRKSSKKKNVYSH